MSFVTLFWISELKSKLYVKPFLDHGLLHTVIKVYLVFAFKQMSLTKINFIQISKLKTIINNNFMN